LLALVAIPWLLGFQPVAQTDAPTPAVAAEVSEWQRPDDRCTATAYGGLAVDSAQSRIVASYSQGVFVLGADRHLIARAPGFRCMGSADELVGLETGDAWIGTPIVALATTSGGHAASETVLSLYRVDADALEPIFTGVVERNESHTTRSGTVTIVPGGLIYHAPDGPTSIWIFNGTRYVSQGTFPLG
jgi:hypothetical protein